MNKDRITELESKIIKAKYDYYNGSSTITDKLYDALVDELFLLDPKNPAVIGIGSDPVSNWEKYTHLIPMGSLNKVQTDDEYVKWHTKYIDNNDSVFLTLKLDGLSVSLIYEGGILAKAVTRGSGIQGELITQNVAKMIGVPLRLKDKLDLTVRGEILLSKENHLKYFSEYSNARNAASGISRRYDGVGSDKLAVLCYQIFCDSFNFITQEDQFLKLIELGFNVPTFYVCKSIDDICKYKKDYQSSLRDKFEYDLDGLVAHNNSCLKQDTFGSLNGRPYASIALKFDSLAKEGTVSDIIVQVGNSGRLTPVAVFSPKINLMGADVERASLHNFTNVHKLGIDIGAKVLVCRSNDVIPYVEEVTQSTGTIFNTPTHCPQCGFAVIISGEYVQCPNTLTCPAQVIGRIKNWISELNILEWGDSLIERLVESGKVTNIVDLYKLSINDLAAIDRMGNKSAKKCYDLLWANTEIPLEVFLGGLSIPLIGQSTIKLIMQEGCDTLEKFEQLDANAFSKVSGVGPIRAQSLQDGLKANQDLILSLLDNGIKIKKIIEGKLSGKSFAITGSLSMKRAEVEKLIVDNGGIIKNSVSKGLTYLIIADPQSTSSKAQAAKKLGIVLLGENDFLSLIN